MESQVQDNPSFLSFNWNENGLKYYDLSGRSMPSRMYTLSGENTFDLFHGSSYFVYQQDGISWINFKYPLERGQFAVVYATEMSPNTITGNPGAQTVIIERLLGGHPTEQYAPFLLGGPIEEEGRLKYIDGCTDSLLIAPWKYGEACLNHLHFPENINQTPHTHPSIRFGIVTKGRGECITPWGNYPLEEGMLFAILPESEYSYKKTYDPNNAFQEEQVPTEYSKGGTHSFRTTDSSMDVIAFHPDSDFGPRDEDHPMINRTIVNGHSAKDIEEIRTK